MENAWKCREKRGKGSRKSVAIEVSGKMPKSLNKNENLPLPYNWEVRHDFDGKIYYIDHTKKITTWIDPRDR